MNYNTYDRLVISIVSPTSPSSSNCGNGGVGSVRTQNTGTWDGATQRLSISWDFGTALGSTALNGKITQFAFDRERLDQAQPTAPAATAPAAAPRR